MKKTQGFTLIELLVVIAIIGILSSVVLASLTTARSKGTSAAVQAELANARAQAELYYSTNSNKYATTDGNTYASPGTSLFTAGAVNGLSTLLSDAAAKGATITGAASTTDWAAQAFVNSTYFCVDSTGKSTTSLSSLLPANSGHCN